MKIVAVMVALGVAIPVIGAGEASATPQRKYSSCDSYCQRFPEASPRQLKNARAFDRGGEYYESGSNNHPVGSRSWWYLRDLEQGRGGRF
jgi:hypothetical protein